MRDYYVHSENFTENELIIDHVHDISRNKLVTSRITGILTFTDHGK